MYIDEKFISERLAQLRIQKGVSARDMSLSIGQNENYINRIENEIAFPSMNGLILICEYLNITLKEFFDTENKNPSDLSELIDAAKNLDDKAIKYLTAFINEIVRNQKDK